MSTPTEPTPTPIPSHSTADPSSAQADQQPPPEPYLDQTSGKWMVETANGDELEWDTARNAWVPVLTEDVLKAQQEAYSVAGVDESAPVPTKDDKKTSKKRKADSSDKANKKPRANTSVFVSSLPSSCTPELLVSTFSKAGLILEDVNGKPKVKLYTDVQGSFKGEALVTYLQEASVELAVRLLDETELVLGSGEKPMSVKAAEWGSKDKKGGEEANGTATAATEGGAEASGSGSVNVSKVVKPRDQQKAKQGKKAAALRQKLGDWSSDDDSASTAAAARKFRGMVVLEGMFTLKELDEDPALLLDLKEDVREECERLGEVTNVTLYDKEQDGVITVRFKDDIAAQACIVKMNNRFFGGRTIKAFPADGSKKYRKSGHGDPAPSSGRGEGEGGEGGEAGEGQSEEEKKREEEERREKYAEWLEKGGE